MVKALELSAVFDKLREAKKACGKFIKWHLENNILKSKMVQTIEPLTDSPELSKIVKQLNESNPETMRPNSNSFRFYLAIIFSCFGGFLFG